MSLIPQDLFYSEEHEWVKVNEDSLIIGITDFAQEQLTDIVYVELPEEGSSIATGEGFGVVESVKSVSDIYAPVTGQIISVNENVIDAPEMINESPYEDGWLVKVKIEDESQLDDLMGADEYKAFIESGD